MSEKKLSYNEKDGYFLNFIKGNPENCEYDEEEKKVKCDYEYKIKILEKNKFKSIIDYFKYLFAYYYNTYKYEIIILWLVIGVILGFSLSFFFYNQIQELDIKFQPENKNNFYKNFAEFFIWLFPIIKFVVSYFIIFVIVIFGIIFILFKIADSKPIVWLISFLVLLFFGLSYTTNIKNIKLNFFLDPFRKIYNRIFSNTDNFKNFFSSDIPIIFNDLIEFSKKYKWCVIVISICIFYFIYKMIIRWYYKKDLYINEAYKIDYKKNIKEKLNNQIKNIKLNFSQAENTNHKPIYSDIFKKEDISGINIEQILGENLYINKYKLLKYIRDNGINITKKYVLQLLNFYSKNNNKINCDAYVNTPNQNGQESDFLDNIDTSHIMCKLKKILNKDNKNFLSTFEIWMFLHSDLYKIVNTYELSKNIDETYIEKDAEHLKTKILINEPRPLNKEFILKDYPNFSVALPNYNFSISSWFFIHEQSPNKNESASNYTTIYNFSNRPHILYNCLKDKIKIIIKNVDNIEKIYYITTGLNIQKWNNLVLNFYSNGILDIFLNNELILTKSNILITSELDVFKTGKENGISGGVCNVVYFSDTLSKLKIGLFYNNFKNKNPPII